MTTAVRVRGLRKVYPGHIAVAGLDLDIHEGEVFALLGPHGADKTTTVEILEGHRQRTAGEAAVLGEDPGKAGREWRSRLGIVLQTATDAAQLTVTEAVRHFAKYYPNPREAEEVIDRVGLSEKAGTRVKSLSGGQRRRVDVALGIIGRPQLLFLDEPTTGFDPEARRQFWGLIESLAHEGTTIMFTSRYLDEVEALVVAGVVAPPHERLGLAAAPERFGNPLGDHAALGDHHEPVGQVVTVSP
ncbi:ABC transporter ATP-binding protein [Amycolatopsis sp. FDAARGOS 1241]|uniref:ABC transporter ATP-binding protein n=1 Tax=Amycolatopsis sp. FDAARGOS 1241 TaxID=2778070 RepID=UPI001EF21292|nr:ABC transporter ATP-binding protein [Amycolatopsis sp. FDAARGOS 1241]